MGSVVDQPVPQSVEAVVLAADDSLLPTPALRWWREKDIYRMAFADALTVVRETDRSIVIDELRAISSYLTSKIRHRQVQTEDELDEYLAEMLLQVWLGERRYRAEDEIEGRFQARAFDVIPRLASEKTDDGLFGLDDDLVLHSHYAILGDMAIPPSMFLRRYYSATPNFVFLGHLGVLASEHPECTVAVALNTAHCAPVSETMHIFEEDYWYGPPFSLDRIDDPSWVGVTRHWTPPPGEPLHYPVAATEFVWQLDSDRLKSLQIEETYYPWESEWDTQDDKPWFVNRYVHSIRDINNRAFVHLDGAVKLFDKVGYEPYERRPKRSALHYKKLFRIDGLISDDDWMQLVAHFLRGNDHVHEYFGSQNPEMSPDEPPTTEPLV